MNRKLKKPPLRTMLLAFAPIVLWYYLIVIQPILIAFYYSLFDWNGGRSMPYAGLENYRILLMDPDFWNAAKNTLILVALCTVGQIGLALLCSFALAAKCIRWKEFHRTVLFFPVVVSAIVIGFIWTIIYNSQIGILNKLLTALGLSSWIRPWLDDPRLVIYSISLPAILKSVGLYLIMFLGAIKSIPEEIMECAELDGVTEYQKSVYITLPMIYSTFKVAVTLCVSGTMRIFDHIMVMTNGGPGKSSEVLALFSYNVSFGRMQLSYGSAIAVGTMLLTLAVTLLSRKVIGRGEPD